MSLIQQLNADYFDNALSDTVLQHLLQVENESQEVQNFVARMCRQLHRQQIKARDFTEMMAWVAGQLLSRILPGAWGGNVPPLTVQGRHALVDEYLAGNPWRALQAGDTLLDLGCGYPPVTTLDTAKRFPEIDIIGADTSFGKYLIREEDGTYALFNAEDVLLYYQAGAADPQRWTDLFSDPVATNDYFSGVLQTLRTQLPEDGDAMVSVKEGGVELVRHPILALNTDRVTFLNEGIGSAGLPKVQMARCFNVLFYFDQAFRERALQWMSGVLEEGGLLVSGGNSSNSRHTRYTVHRNEDGVLRAKEFAFSVENIRPTDLVAVFALHDDDHDTAVISALVGALRSDSEFCRDIDRRMDEIMAQIRLCARKPDGYLGSVDFQKDMAVMHTGAVTIGTTLEQEGFARRAVDLLNDTGIDAWVNCLGHIAVDPASVSALGGVSIT